MLRIFCRGHTAGGPREKVIESGSSCPPQPCLAPLCLDLSLQLKAAESLFPGPAETSEQAGYSCHVSVSRAACLNYSSDEELLHRSQWLHFFLCFMYPRVCVCPWECVWRCDSPKVMLPWRVIGKKASRTTSAEPLRLHSRWLTRSIWGRAGPVTLQPWEADFWLCATEELFFLDQEQK